MKAAFRRKSLDLGLRRDAQQEPHQLSGKFPPIGNLERCPVAYPGDNPPPCQSGAFKLLMDFLEFRPITFGHIGFMFHVTI